MCTYLTLLFYFILSTSHCLGLGHCFVEAYAPWNLGGSDSDFWGQVSNTCLQLQYSWTLASDVNATVSGLERASRGQDARRQSYTSYRIWVYKTCGCSNWTDLVIGIGRVGPEAPLMVETLLIEWKIKGLHNAEIGVVDRSTYYIPMTDHREIFAYIQIELLDGIQPSHVKFTYHDLLQYLGKPRLQYLSSFNNKKYSKFRIKVDEAIKAESIHLTPVIDDASLIRRHEILTHILKQCGKTVLGHVKRGGKLMHGKITLPRIQHIQAQIKNLGGALRMTNPNHMGAVSHMFQLCFYQRMAMFCLNTEKCTDICSFLLLHRRRMYKFLYNKQMQEFYTHSHDADKKHATGTLLEGSTERLLISGKYNGLPTTINSLNIDDELIMEPDAIKRVTKEYWMKLYK